MCNTNKSKIDFLYLSEQDMLDAGVMDVKRCIDTEAEVMKLLVEGDYLEGGPNGQSHGIMVSFPKKSDIKGFPLNDSPDRRFMAMPAYLGGKFHMMGEKWYGSNMHNQKNGLPRSILMVMLNDVMSGAPKAMMSANVLSAVRTGCMPGLAVRYLARKDSHVLTSIGAGVIAKTSILAVLSEIPQIEELRIKGSTPTSKTAASCKAFIEERFPNLKITISATLEEAVCGADIILESVSEVKEEDRPVLEPAWIKPGCTIISSSCLIVPDEYVAKNVRMVVDNVGMYENYLEDRISYLAKHPKEAEKQRKNPKHALSVGMAFIDMREAGLIKTEDIVSIGKIISGAVPGRTNDDEIFLAGFDGMPVLDVAWGYECYQNALKQGIGTSLNLWDTPFLA